MTIRYLIAITSIFCIFITSCKIGKEYSRPVMEDMPSNFENDADYESGVPSDIGWSTFYTDTVLQKLIDQALENNKDVLIATARIKEMIANKRIKFAGLFPEIGIEGLANKEFLNYGGHSQKYDPEVHGIFTPKWEIDIWGNLRWQNEGGIADYMQSVEAQRALKLTIVAQVAQTYFGLKALDRELEIVKQTLISRKEAVHLAKLRYDGGLTSEIPYRQSLVELARTETLVPSLQNEIKLQENDLFILLGEFPAQNMIRSYTKFDLDEEITPAPLIIDLPSTLLERRPDVREAEQKLIKANADVGVALTDMFPKLTLTGKLGAETDEFSNFLKSPTWFVQGLLTGPVFNMGKNKAKHRAAQAAFEQELYRYEKTIINVFKEVNNAIITYQKVKEVRASREGLYESATSYLKLARLQYINGIINYIDVLDAQRQLFDAEISLNDAILQELLAAVSLYKVLGGGLDK